MRGFVRLGFNIPLDRTFVYEVFDGFQTIQIGARVKAELGKRILTGIVLEKFTELQPSDPDKSLIKSVISIIDSESLLTHEHIELAKKMAEIYFCSVSEALFTMLAASVKGKPRINKKDKYQKKQEPLTSLTSQQLEIVKEIKKYIKDGIYNSFLIFGVTGSGKSEIYHHLIEETLKNNKSVMLLVPEINLASQTIHRLTKFFPYEIISVLHSRMTSAQKALEWKSLLKGEKKIVVGARSAVFAPLKNPGLFILDEEQSSSYKEHGSPRYHARQIAWLRARMNNSVLVLGSATPSVETFYAAEKKIFKPFFLKERYGQASLPVIKVVQTGKMGSELSSELIDAIKLRLLKKEQIMILQNRRGFSDIILCPNCKTTIKCPNCTISLTYHKVSETLQCHYCGYKIPRPQNCPSCSYSSLIPIGTGTQKVEFILKKLFPDARIVRYDTDSTRSIYTAENVYFDFLHHKIDILVGTQMLSKGLDFPNVTLAGVVDFESMAALPDFRSFENTFSLLLQLAGRTGRGKKPGEVIIQTQDPNHPLISFIKNSDFESFYKKEIQVRKEALYPPFCRLLRILFRAKKETAVIESAERVSKLLEEKGKNLFSAILGPAPAFLSKLQGFYRYHILLKFSRYNPSIKSLIISIKNDNYHSGTKCDIDPDPLSLL